MLSFSNGDIAIVRAFLDAALYDRLDTIEPPRTLIDEARQQLAAALRNLLPFVPSPVVQHCIERSDCRRLDGVHLEGTLMLVSLPGMASLSAQLFFSERRSNEQFSAVLNRLLAPLLTEVDARGGGLVYSGDNPLVAFFDAARCGEAHAARACAAALAVVRASAGDPELSAEVLQPRIAIHTGRLFVAEVGDHEQTRLVVAGDAIRHVARVHAEAAPGQVLVTAATRALLPGAHVREQQPGVFALDALPYLAGAVGGRALPATGPDLQDLVRRIAIARPYLPRGLPERFVGTNLRRGEFRPVTVLLIELPLLSRLLALADEPAAGLQPGTIGTLVDTCYTSLQQVVHRYGGIIDRIDTTAHTCRVKALFGAPVAHEDDALRAVGAAFEARGALANVHQEVAGALAALAAPGAAAALAEASAPRLSIAVGNVFAGIAGTARRHDYVVVGSTVLIAAQMLDVARPGDIVLSSWVYQATQQTLDAEPLALLTLDSFKRPMPVLRAIRLSAPSGVPADRLAERAPAPLPLVGRRAEWRMLAEYARDVLATERSAGHVLVLTGNAGIGKSRLVDELLREIPGAVPHALAVRVACQSYEQNTPYAFVVRLLRRLLRLHDLSLSSVEAFQHTLGTLVPDMRPFVPLLGRLLNLPQPETELIRLLTPEQRRDRLHVLIVELCKAIARQRPLLLIGEDLHWADASSLAILEQLAIEAPEVPLLLLLVYRPGAIAGEPWRELAHCTPIALKELTEAESYQLLQALLDGEPPAELSSLVAGAQGLPLFIEEIVRYLRDSGVLRRDLIGRWSLAYMGERVAVPLRIEQMVIARLDRLREATRTLAQVAAVIGHRVPSDLLAMVAPQPDHMHQQLDELVEAAILVPDGDHAAYRFRNALLHDVIYSSILYAQRHELHLLVATALESLAAAEDDAYLVLLAQHYLGADRRDRAFPLFVRAAHQARARFANFEALALYQQAYALAPWNDLETRSIDPEQAIAFHEHFGDVLAQTGDYASARASYQWPLNMLGDAGDEPAQIRAAALLRKIGGTHERQGALEQALDLFGTAAARIAHLESDRALLEHGRIMSDIGWVHFRRGNLEQARLYLDQALAAADRCGADDERVRVLNRLGGIAWSRGDIAQARHFVEQSLAASRRTGDLVSQANALNNLGILTESQGQIAEALHYSQQAMEIHRQIGNRRDVAMTHINIGWAYYDDAAYQQAQQHFMLAFAQAMEVHDTFLQMRALLNLGRVFVATGELEKAEQHVLRSQFIAAQLRLPSEQLECHVLLAEIALRRGRLDAAVAEFDQALPLVEDPESEEYGRLIRVEAQLALARADRERARELLNTAEQLFLRLHNLPEAARTNDLRATLFPDLA